ncbi:unnamed protein product [Candidula unifasciata]|uniref:DML1/Misato tubulin domain-containing protein n=1 Tax=Candidula unifasciata TaxID=100452 RepID=A0A8S3ZJU1_9EUPU|nr:unnamed protein product [Candidula unifasciata]
MDVRDGDNTLETDSDAKTEEKVFGKRFYNLDSDIQVWSDFLQTGFHPRSIHLLQDYHHNHPDQPFNIFGVGQQVCSDKRQWDIIEDNIRYFAEECDFLQGFQILLDNYNAFGGVAASVLSYLSDEFASKSRLSFAVTPASPCDQTATERSARILNTALSLHHCGGDSSLFVPLSLASALWKSVGPPIHMPHLEYNASSDYHTSAILAASLDTMTMPFRKETHPEKMVDVTSLLSSYGRKVSALNTSFPLPLKLGSSIADCLLGFGETDPWMSLTPHVKCSSLPLFNSCVVRGVPAAMTKCDPHPGSLPGLLSSCSSVADVLGLYLRETYPGSYNTACVMRDGLKVTTPFPHIFSSHINQQGYLTDTLRSPVTGVETVAAMTSLQSSVDVCNYITSLETCVSRFNIAKHQHFLEAGLEVDEFAEVIQGLQQLAHCYPTNN